ncbi:MAG: DUF4352 domain-containing protein [Chloroflexota bacterium]
MPPEQTYLESQLDYYFDEHRYPTSMFVPDQQTQALIQARRSGLLIGIGSTLTIMGSFILVLVLIGLCSGIFLWRFNMRLAQQAQIPASVPETMSMPHVDLSSTPSPSPTVIPILPTAHPQVRLGQPLVDPQIGLQVTVWEVTRQEEYISITLELRNISHTHPVAYQVSDFRLQDKTGITYFPQLVVLQDQQLQSGVLVINEKREGVLLFQIPQDIVATTLLWQNADYPQSPKMIQLK